MERIFGISEISNSKELKAICYVILINITFSIQYFSYAIPAGAVNPLCFPFFQDCASLQNIFLLNFWPELRFPLFAIWHLLIYICFTFLYLDKIKNFFVTLLLFHIFIFTPLFILTGYHHDYFTYPMHYVYLATSVLLFAKVNKFFYLQLFFVLTYFLSAISKFESESWLLGNMILPFLNQNLVFLFSHFLILLQLFSPLLLFSQNRYLRILTIVILEIFHIYTISLVNIDFYIITSPMLLILFYGQVNKFNFKKVYSSFLAFSVLLIFVFFNVLRLLIPKSDSITFEGAYLGLNMFQSEISCEISYQNKDMEEIKLIRENNKSYQRCDPYTVLNYIKRNCVDSKERGLNLIINFVPNSYEVVNEKNYCNLEYNAFRRNSWIKDEEISRNTDKLNYFGRKFFKHKDLLSFFYFSIFLAISIFFLIRTAQSSFSKKQK